MTGVYEQNKGQQNNSRGQQEQLSAGINLHLLAEGEAEMRSNSVLCYCTLFRYLYSVISDSFSLSPPTSEHKCRLT